MRMKSCLAMVVLTIYAIPTLAHFNMLHPQTAIAKKGDAVTFLYQWGHPFEHQLFDAPRPESLIALTPGGQQIDLLSTLEKTTVPGSEGKNVTAYRFRYTPAERGDYVFLLKTPPIWMEEEGEYFQDTVKVVLHVQAQKGWNAAAGVPLEIVPLTRPYGLQPGMAFLAQVDYRTPDGSSTASAAPRPVEIERFNAQPPKELPADEHVTRTARTDKNGVVTGTLTDAGWWCLTAARQGGTLAHDGKERPVLQRSTFWVFVDEKPVK
jgi:cobalt/nickel transport protein